MHSILIIIFRQVDPEKNKPLADSQSKETQIENMRTVKVNAQVTAMISFSEVVGYVIISIICQSSRSATMGDVLFPLLANIILPYAFLRNTRENKHRIVEQGWRNVLRNALNMEIISSILISSNKVKPFNDEQKDKEPDVFVVSKNVKNTSHIVTTALLQKTTLTESGVNEVIYDIPCTSNNIKRIDNRDRSCLEVVRSLSKSSQESTINEMVNLTYRKELLENLLLNTDEESVYLSLLTRLISFEQDHSFEETDIEDFSMIHQEMIKDKVSRLLIKPNRRHRIDKRENTIKILRNLVNNESKYQETFQEFLDMEEKFLDE